MNARFHLFGDPLAVSRATNPYAVDGLCHNAHLGTYGHECGKPADWLGVTSDGWVSGFCDDCKRTGYEARRFVRWERRAT
jgi:hypothetical protein